MLHSQAMYNITHDIIFMHYEKLLSLVGWISLVEVYKHGLIGYF